MYDGKIVSPASNDYTYLYINELGDEGERAILVLIHNKGKEERYKGGVGCLFSLSRGQASALCLQKIVLFREDIYMSIEQKILKGTLKDQLNRYLHIENQITGDILYMDCLKLLNKQWYEQYKMYVNDAENMIDE